MLQILLIALVVLGEMMELLMLQFHLLVVVLHMYGQDQTTFLVQMMILALCIQVFII